VPNIIIIKSRGVREARHVTHLGKKRNAYRILVGNSEGKIPLRRQRQEDDIKMVLGETVWVCMG
jgi:hypothetical protein